MSRRNSIFPSTRVDSKTMPAGASKPQAVARSLSPGKRTSVAVPEPSRSPHRNPQKLGPRGSIAAAKQLKPTPSTLSAPRALLARNSITQSTLTHRRTSTIATSRPSTILRPRVSVAPSTRRMSTLGSTTNSVKRRESIVPPLPTFPRKPLRSSIMSEIGRAHV